MRFLKYVTAVFVAVASVNAQAALISYDGDYESDIQGNFYGITEGYLGATVKAEADLVVTYEFLGAVAGWSSLFHASGNDAGYGSFYNHGGTDQDIFSLYVNSGDYLDFSFDVITVGQQVYNTPGLFSNAENYAANRDDENNNYAEFLISELDANTYYLGLNDDGGIWDWDYGDLAVKLTVTEKVSSVPEPSTLVLLGLGLIGLGVARKKA